MKTSFLPKGNTNTKNEPPVGSQKETIQELEMSRSALLNMLEDVTQAMRRAEEEKNKTMAIITNFSDGLLFFSKTKKLLLANPQIEIFFQVKIKDIIGKPVKGLAQIASFKKLIDFIGEDLKRIFRKEFPVQENLILEASAIPITFKKKSLGTLVILHDVTREKRVEKMKTEFVSIAAHQLRTPLSAIKWTLQMLLDRDLGEINAEQEKFINRTYQSNERMINLINDLLDITRIEEGRYLYNPVAVDIKKIVAETINSLKRDIEKKHIKLEFKKPGSKLPKLKLDKEKTGLAIYNLIENAIRYSQRGGKVTVSLKNLGKEIEFKVEDNGIGIPKNQHTKVFNKFFRGGNAVRMETEGTGLGLFITQNVIEAHGGKVWFESEEKKGTTVYFTLPIIE